MRNGRPRPASIRASRDRATARPDRRGPMRPGFGRRISIPTSSPADEGRDLFEVLLALGRAYSLPVLVAAQWFARFPIFSRHWARMTSCSTGRFSSPPKWGGEQWAAYYRRALEQLSPGVTSSSSIPATTMRSCAVSSTAKRSAARRGASAISTSSPATSAGPARARRIARHLARSRPLLNQGGLRRVSWRRLVLRLHLLIGVTSVCRSSSWASAAACWCSPSRAGGIFRQGESDQPAGDLQLFWRRRRPQRPRDMSPRSTPRRCAGRSCLGQAVRAAGEASSSTSIRSP